MNLNFKDWMLCEEIFFQNADVTVRDAEPDDIPRFFIHRTEKKEDALSILHNGFNLNKFGRTGRQTRQTQLCNYDPKGVYALDMNYPEEELNSYDTRPYVIFTANISKALVIEEKGITDAKMCVSQYFGKIGAQLRNLLMKKGYQAILRPKSEQIILDTNIITIVKIGNV